MVRPGYKLTEVGVIPEEWEVKRLDDFAIIATGSTPPTSNPENYGDDYLFVSPVDLGKVKYITHTEKMLSIDGFSISRIFPRGSILFVCIGSTIGKTGIASTELTSNQQINAVFPSETVSSDFLYYAISAAAPRIKAFAGEHAVPIVNKSQFSGTKVALPPLPEQRAIATALSDVDALLSELGRLISKKRDLKQAAIQQLLTSQTRFPGFRGKWDEVKLGDLFIFKNGLNKERKFFGYGTPIVNYMDVFKSRAICATDIEGRVSLTPQERQNFDVRKGDVFFTRTSETPEEIGIASVMFDDPVDTVFSGFVLRARPLSDRLNDRFKAYCFGSTFVRKQIVSKASYTTRALTNGRILSQVLLPLPTLPEQTAIASVLSDMDAELTALEARRDKTRALKQAMMQELLTGRTRLV